VEFDPCWAFNEPMETSAEEEGTDPDWEADAVWETVPLRIPADVGRTSAAAQLSLHAEFGGWELARVSRYSDGTRRVWLRRRRHPATSLPLPGLYV
jgi:hypothetical protein